MTSRLTHLLSLSLLSLLFLSSSAVRTYTIKPKLVSPTVTGLPTSPLVTTALGSILGRTCETSPDIGEFLGIPFALPPVGNLRFSPPVAYSNEYPKPSLQAISNPAACGTYSGAIGSLEFQAVNSSEDCLYLNLWAPKATLNTDVKLPVRVYIHGGHDLECSASDPYLNGCIYAFKTNSIVVNIQFRKGVFGFFAHPATMAESNTTGNWGLLDQQLALKWIIENIGSFGGDPSKIMINGNSAGGQYVDLQMLSPLAKGLFHSAVSQSPPCVKLLTLEEGYAVGAEFLGKLGCPTSQKDLTAEIDCIRGQDWATVFDLAAEINLNATLYYAMCESLQWTASFQAVKDNYVFSYDVIEALGSGEFNQVPYMVGFAANEGTHFMDPQDVTNSTMSEMLTWMYPGADVQKVIDLYPLEEFYGSADVEKARVSSMWTDIFFMCPIYERTATMQKNADSAVYMYYWDVTPTCPEDTVYLQATHGSEILFTYGFTKQINPPWGTCDFNDEEVKVSDIVLNGWNSMSDDGVPKWANGESWSAWTPETSKVTTLATSASGGMKFDFVSKCSVIMEAKLEALKTM